MKQCIYCGVPQQGDNEAGHPVPLCRTLQKMDAARTPNCKYIEKLRRAAEDLDTAVMGITSGLRLGGTHVSPPLAFGVQAREKYEEFGEFLLDAPTTHGGGACHCKGDVHVVCYEYDHVGVQACRVGQHRLELDDGVWQR